MAIVQRPPADKPGEDIISPLLVSDSLQVERGRQEINRNSTDRTIQTGRVLLTDFIRPGSIVELRESNNTVRGIITGFSLDITISGNAQTTNTSVTTEAVL